MYANEIKPLEDREVFGLAGNLRKGVPMGTQFRRRAPGRRRRYVAQCWLHDSDR